MTGVPMMWFRVALLQAIVGRFRVAVELPEEFRVAFAVAFGAKL